MKCPNCGTTYTNPFRYLLHRIFAGPMSPGD